LHLCRFFLFSFPDATGRLITFDEWEEFSDPEVFEDYYLDDGYDEENDPPYGWDDGW